MTGARSSPTVAWVWRALALVALLGLHESPGRARADAPVPEAVVSAEPTEEPRATSAAPPLSAADRDHGEQDQALDQAPDPDQHQDEAPATRPPLPHRHAIFVYPYALLRRGVVLGYEYAVPRSRLGLLVEYSFERRARGDFRSTASGFGLGWRVYLLGRSRFGSFDGPACVGIFLGGMGSLRVVGVREANGRRVVGRATRGTAEGQLGFRIPIRGKAEISAMGTVGFQTDFVGGLALQLRPSVGFALAVGVLL